MKNIVTQLAAAAMAISTPAMAQDNLDDSSKTTHTTIDKRPSSALDRKVLDRENCTNNFGASVGIASASISTTSTACMQNNTTVDTRNSTNTYVGSSNVSSSVGGSNNVTTINRPMSEEDQKAWKAYRKANPENYKLTCADDGGSISIKVNGKTTSIETENKWGDKEKFTTTRTIFYNVADAKSAAYYQCSMGALSHHMAFNGTIKAVEESKEFFNTIQDIYKGEDITQKVGMKLSL